MNDVLNFVEYPEWFSCSFPCPVWLKGAEPCR
jgi:hypothetical protein